MGVEQTGMIAKGSNKGKCKGGTDSSVDESKKKKKTTRKKKR